MTLAQTEIDTLIVPLLPESSPITERRVFNAEIGVEHALGAQVVRNIEIDSLATSIIDDSARLIIPDPNIGRITRAVGFVNRHFVPGSVEAVIAARAAEDAETARVAKTLAGYKIENGLDDARAKLAHKAKDIDMVFNRVYERDLPEDLQTDYSRHVREDSGLPKDVQDWITEETPEGNNRLRAYLEHQVTGREEVQDHETLNRALETQKRLWLQATKKSINAGWNSGDMQRAERGMQELTTVFGDYFDLYMHELGGYAYIDKNYIVLGASENEIDSLAMHEFNHVRFGKLEGKWADEAITEHVAQVFKGLRGIENISGGQIDPETQRVLKSRSDRTYRAARHIVGNLIWMARDNLTVSDFTRASSKNVGDSNVGQIEIEQLLDDLFGVEGVYKSITKYVKKAENSYRLLGQGRTKAFNNACEDVSHLLQNDPISIFGEGFRLPEVGARYIQV